MNDRLEQFLKAENISQSQFADTIGVARASVSHILAGRNKPGFEFIASMSQKYPTLNLEWLITGKGKMYKSGQEPPTTPSLFTTPEDSTAAEVSENRVFGNADVPTVKESLSAYKAIAKDKPIEHTESQRHITKVVVFFDDNTYQELK